MKKKIFALLLAMCMVFGMTSVALGAEVTTLAELGTVEVALEAGDSEGEVYSYTVPNTVEGTVMITVSAKAYDGDYVINVDNLTTGDYAQSIYYLEYGYAGAPANLKAAAGDEIQITVKAYANYNMETDEFDYPARNITWKASMAVVGTKENPEEIGSMDNWGSFSYEGSTSVVPNTGKYYYEYTAETTGTLSVYVNDFASNPSVLKDLAAEIVLTNAYTGASATYTKDAVDFVVNSMWGSNTYKAVQLNVNAGDVVIFEFSSKAAVEEAVIAWNATISEPVGSQGNPIVIADPTTKMEVKAGEGLYFEVPFEYLELAESITITGGAAMTIVDGMTRFMPDENGVMAPEFAEAMLYSWNGPVFALVNMGEEDTEYTINFELPVGVAINPEVLEGEAASAEQEVAGDYYGYYYTWKAPADGIVNIKLGSEATDWRLVVTTDTAWEQVYSSESEGVSLQVKKDEAVTIQVMAVEITVIEDEETGEGYTDWEPVAGTIETNVVFTEAVGEIMDDETVAEITDGLSSGQYEDEDSIVLNVEEEGVAENPVTVLSPSLLNAVIEYNALNEENLGITIVTNNYTWYVNNIVDAAPVDLGVTFDTTNTPEETIDEVAEGNDYITFSIAHNGDFGFDAVVEFTIDEAYAGKTVALYWDNNGELELVSEKAVVNEDGTISFAMEHASDYVIVVEGTAPVVEDPVKPVPPTGDTTNVALWIALLGLGVVAIAGSVVMKKREF